MFYLIESLKELIKSYTIAQAVANTSGAQADIDYALTLLNQINQIRLNCGTQAEMVEIFWNQLTIALATNVNTVNNRWFSKNDKEWILRRGIANLDAGATISLLNQGERQKAITRDAVPWQQLFSSVQAVALGNQVTFDLPEALRFSENQALNIAIQGEATGVGSVPEGYLFLHGATLKQSLTDSEINALREEFLEDNGTTKYLPETQLVPLIFQFTSATVGTQATDPNGSTDIFSVKSERSVLLLGLSTTPTSCRIQSLKDEGRNQTLCENIEIEGIAAHYTNPYTTYYPLPYPHLLRKGNRLKASFLQGSPMLNTTVSLNILQYVTFIGITL